MGMRRIVLLVASMALALLLASGVALVTVEEPARAAFSDAYSLGAWGASSATVYRAQSVRY
jgi:hypothetical protein